MKYVNRQYPNYACIKMKKYFILNVSINKLLHNVSILDGSK